jgi:hypothetical protein
MTLVIAAAEGGIQLFPDTSELVWGLVAFLLLMLFMAKFVFPKANAALEERSAAIQGRMEEADAKLTEAEETRRRFEASIADARGEANRIIEEARQAAEQVRADIVAKAEAEAAASSSVRVPTWPPSATGPSRSCVRRSGRSPWSSRHGSSSASSTARRTSAWSTTTSSGCRARTDRAAAHPGPAATPRPPGRPTRHTMTTDRTSAYAQAVVTLATADDALEVVEDELLTVARAVDAHEELAAAADRHPPAGRATARARGVGRARRGASDHTGRDRAADHRRADGRDRRRSRTRSPSVRPPRATRSSPRCSSPSTSTTRARCAQGRARAGDGTKLDLKVVVDDSVVGGVRARIGDTVIDGSVLRRLTELRARVGG